ncbi:hypothetical protein MCOR32_010741, partial [Pyricularia oryzae]
HHARHHQPVLPSPARHVRRAATTPTHNRLPALASTAGLGPVPVAFLPATESILQRRHQLHPSPHPSRAVGRVPLPELRVPGGCGGAAELLGGQGEGRRTGRRVVVVWAGGGELCPCVLSAGAGWVSEHVCSGV